MTETTRPPAGVFIVRDPDVCAALEQLLAPHRTDRVSSAPGPAADGSASIAALMASAEAYVTELTDVRPDHLPEGATIETLLALVHTEGISTGRGQATAEGRDWSEAMADRVKRAEAALAHAERDVDTTTAQLQDALAKIADLESDVATAGREKELADGELAKLRKTVADLHDDLTKARQAPPAPPAPRATGSRIADKRAFSTLADLMDNQARTAKSADAGAALRLAARAVRKEIAAVYGPVEKKAS